MTLFTANISKMFEFFNKYLTFKRSFSKPIFYYHLLLRLTSGNLALVPSYSKASKLCTQLQYKKPDFDQGVHPTLSPTEHLPHFSTAEFRTLSSEQVPQKLCHSCFFGLYYLCTMHMVHENQF
jgi:hypothetical protein